MTLSAELQRCRGLSEGDIVRAPSARLRKTECLTHSVFLRLRFGAPAPRQEPPSAVALCTPTCGRVSSLLRTRRRWASEGFEKGCKDADVATACTGDMEQCSCL
ncbi:MAG: hypothetical protein IJG56_00790, partial [Clostridia bacterium]|nr:hypothetical protein [Clostridia bacterium]